MRLLFLLLAGVILHAQVTVTGTLTDSSGQPANCSITITPKAVYGVAPTTVTYQVLNGDLTGAQSYYGTAGGTQRHVALAITPGTTNAIFACSGDNGSGTYTFKIPSGASTVTITDLIGGTIPPTGIAPRIWQSAPVFNATTISVPYTQHNLGPNVLWQLYWNGKWSEVNGTLDSYGNITASWDVPGQVYIRVIAGLYSAPVNGGTAIILGTNSGLNSDQPYIQCYNQGVLTEFATGTVDAASFDLNLNFGRFVTGRCVVGVI